MQETKILKLADFPQWYDLVYDTNTSSFLVKIHKECIGRLKKWSADNRMIRSILIQAQLDDMFCPFTWDMESPTFGINGVIVRHDDTGDYLTFKIAIPLFRTFSHETCTMCDGTKRDGFEEDTDKERACRRCDGTGKQVVMDWPALYKAGISLYLLLRILDFPPEKDTSSNLKQLCTYGLLLTGEHCGLGGEVSPEFMRLLWEKEEETESVVEQVRDAMNNASLKMYGLHSTDRKYLRATLGRKFSLKCAGDACFVYIPYQGDNYDGRGSSYSDHNIDNPMQALILLAGLATYTSLVRNAEVIS